ncbi:MAG: 16S rRNA (guanine(527)-N(7))-methyltransferase RsmG [Bacteroidales bacterium]|jgi:16S rRNA (guanine527-N7)-methyltransferase|nr:16S rRNA (guanine(527)-N(7))-methyltransferase RsmG [Bacteroidales bacterium]
MPENIFKYFPSLSPLQKEQISGLKPLYDEWNNKINVISRRDMDNFYIRHVLHSMSIARVITFRQGSSILDTGTGGGFPGIPLAILFPGSEFTLLDSTGKKIKVAGSVSDALKLNNVKLKNKRVEDEKGKYEFITGRAVTEFNSFVQLTCKNLKRDKPGDQENGIIYLKGGDFGKEADKYRDKIRIWDIKNFFTEPFFETKRIIFLPASAV